MSESKDTKSKILDAADKLFAENGFDGTSIREIAKAAEVNIAAINYHFKNKQTLYWEVSLKSQYWLEENIERLAQQSSSVEELNWNIFNFLTDESTSLKNAFMRFISDSMPEVDEEYKEKFNEKEEVGPPGGKYILEKITQEVGSEASEEGRIWAVKNIFSVVVHWALIMSTEQCRKIHEDHPDFKTENIRKFLSDNVRSTLEFLKNNPRNWD